MVVPRKKPTTGRRVAVVGASAGSLLLPSWHEWGTMSRSLSPCTQLAGVTDVRIPAFRLPKQIVKAEIDAVLLLGVDLKLNHLAGRSVTIKELLDYDAVFLGTVRPPLFYGPAGRESPGVYSANEFLARVNLMHADRCPSSTHRCKRGSRVAVAGGGNVAMDAARVALRLGGKVTLVYRRREEDFPPGRPRLPVQKRRG